jgi:hypothetical protein
VCRQSNGLWGRDYLGWWGIYPGNNAIVYGGDWDELSSYVFFAEQDVGTAVWSGSAGEPFDRSHCTTSAAFHECGSAFSDTGPCSGGRRLLRYRNVNISGKCDGYCFLCPGAEDFTLSLTQ